MVEHGAIGVTVRANTVLHVIEPCNSSLLGGKQLLAVNVTVTGALRPADGICERSHSRRLKEHEGKEAQICA